MDKFDLLEPELLYTRELKDKHHENVVNYFKKLVEKSHIDVEANKATCKKYYKECEVLEGLRKKLRRLRALQILFIFLCLLIVGIFLLIFIYKPKKKVLDEEITKQEALVQKLLDEAYSQMAPLNNLFESSIPSKIMETTTPLIDMDRLFDVKKYELLRDKYGMWDNSDENSSTLDLQSGNILGNPFVIFKDINKKMIMQRYEGTLMISYYSGFGKDRHLVHETLHAHVDKPKPVYSKETYLVYGNEAANHLTFSRHQSNINTFKDEKDIDKYVRHHEKDLTKLAEKAMKKGGTYTPLGNSEFELFFGGLDRNNEVEYRLLFTPLAQKSMLQVLKSKVGFGDDFTFLKENGLNVITSAHSQGTALFVDVETFKGFDYEKVEKFFIEYNDQYFKCLFFDFAPLLSIPLYQQHKAHEYIYKNNVGSNFPCFEHEVVANKFNPNTFRPLNGKTDLILKTRIERKDGEVDVVKVTSHSHNMIRRTEMVATFGGDGRTHMVPVEWIDYVPVQAEGEFSVSDLGTDDEVKFRSLGQQGVIYAKGLVSGNALNVDINKLKSLMQKED